MWPFLPQELRALVCTTLALSILSITFSIPYFRIRPAVSISRQFSVLKPCKTLMNIMDSVGERISCAADINLAAMDLTTQGWSRMSVLYRDVS